MASRSSRTIVPVFLLFVWFSAARCISPAVAECGASGPPGIEFTHVPPYGSSEWISGRVLNVVPQDYEVALFIFIPGLGWWTKPYYNPPAVAIQSDCTFTAPIVTGGADATATKICAYLMPVGSNCCCAQGGDWLPFCIQDTVASVCATRQNPNQRRIAFSGYEWLVKSADVRVGPGPNWFSESTDNVWVDEQGRLHLRLTKRNGEWYCAEVMMEQTLGYGVYRFYLDSRVDNLDPSIVLGLFTWNDDAAFSHREIDFEFSKWRDPSDPFNAQFVVQPATADRKHRFWMPDAAFSVHTLRWRPNSVCFQSVTGANAADPAPATIVQEWRYSGAGSIPPTGGETVHMNLWLAAGVAPTDGQEREIIIRKFEFLRPALIANPSTRHPIILMVQDRLVFTIWGTVTARTDDAFDLDDASGSLVRVEAPDHGLSAGDQVFVTGTLRTGVSPPVLRNVALDIQKLN